MAFEVDITQKSIDVLSEVFEAAPTFSDVSKIISTSATLAAAFPVVSAALVLIGSFLPDRKHEQVLRSIKNVGNKIDQVRHDIEELKHDITWEFAMQLYADHETVVELGMHDLFEIADARGINETTMHKKNLNETCARRRCTLALNALLAGVDGSRPSHFRNSILGKFYDKTGGNRPKMSALATRLLQLIYGGMTVVSTYERMVGLHGQSGALKLDRQWKSACASVKSALDECTQNFRVNMLNDLNNRLDYGGSNRVLVNNISEFMSVKYDWLENFCLVYDDVHGSDKHCFNGYRVDSLHRNGKCGIVFYRTKGEPPRIPDRYDDAYDIVSQLRTGNAQRSFNDLESKIDERGIDWTGFAVITDNPDIRSRGTFATKIIEISTFYKPPEGMYVGLSKTRTSSAILLLK